MGPEELMDEVFPRELHGKQTQVQNYEITEKTNLCFPKRRRVYTQREVRPLVLTTHVQ